LQILYKKKIWHLINENLKGNALIRALAESLPKPQIFSKEVFKARTALVGLHIVESWSARDGLYRLITHSRFHLPGG
jgi:hypothetical protein